LCRASTFAVLKWVKNLNDRTSPAMTTIMTYEDV
jgi:hypothetical protein